MGKKKPKKLKPNNLSWTVANGLRSDSVYGFISGELVKLYNVGNGVFYGGIIENKTMENKTIFKMQVQDFGKFTVCRVTERDCKRFPHAKAN
jgi:hypothetical protein